MIAIVGGGICGLSIGWHLARAGRSVTIFERGEAGHGATWAAAGMLAAQIEAEPGEDALLPLMVESRDLWPEFARELEAAAGMAVDLRREGTLAVALDRDEAAQLAFTFDFHRSLGLEMEWLEGHRARAVPLQPFHFQSQRAVKIEGEGELRRLVAVERHRERALAAQIHGHAGGGLELAGEFRPQIAAFHHQGQQRVLAGLGLDLRRQHPGRGPGGAVPRLAALEDRDAAPGAGEMPADGEAADAAADDRDHRGAPLKRELPKREIMEWLDTLTRRSLRWHYPAQVPWV